ncbi:hypothetical protein CRG86_005415 [Photobacterium leiognathi]|nr:hypothetical protein CRG86_005415 [Photobacterium leiognathi]
MAVLDPHNINPAFNCNSNVRKAILNLKGILKGISADSHLTEEEVLFINMWLKDQVNIKKMVTYSTYKMQSMMYLKMAL